MEAAAALVSPHGDHPHGAWGISLRPGSGLSGLRGPLRCQALGPKPPSPGMPASLPPHTASSAAPSLHQRALLATPTFAKLPSSEGRAGRARHGTLEGWAEALRPHTGGGPWGWGHGQRKHSHRASVTSLHRHRASPPAGLCAFFSCHCTSDQRLWVALGFVTKLPPQGGLPSPAAILLLPVLFPDSPCPLRK